MRLKEGLFDLISNVLLIEAPGGAGEYHFRLGMEQTASFRQLYQPTQVRLKDLYVDYFFRRQEKFWMREAMQKLPALKRVTNMLICGEDLGMVPACVHDMSTLRGWWLEDKKLTQLFFNQELGETGPAPAQCDPGINEKVIRQHLESPAMWSIFQLQDLLGMEESLRRPEVDAERINVPAIVKYYWRYRMHLPLETLARADKFNGMVKNLVRQSGR